MARQEKKLFKGNRRHFPIHPAAGFRDDMEILYQKYFTLLEAPQEDKPLLRTRMQNFVQAWNDSDFYCVYRGAKNVNELREIIEEMYIEAMKDLNPEKDLDRRVAAVFLLTCLYLKQPITGGGPVPIPMDMNTWLWLKNILFHAIDARQSDVCVAYSELTFQGGINFVAHSRPLGPAVVKNLDLLSALEKSSKPSVDSEMVTTTERDMSVSSGDETDCSIASNVSARSLIVERGC